MNAIHTSRDNRILYTVIIAIGLSVFACGGDAARDFAGALLVQPSGEVLVTPPQGESFPFRTDMASTALSLIEAGTRVETGKESSVDLQFQTGVSMRLGAFSDVTLTQSQVVMSADQTRVLLDLNRGRVMTRVQSLTEESEVTIRTPTAVASVRGTEFLAIEEDLNALLVNEGSVEVSGADETEGEGAIVEEGNRAEVDEGEVNVEELDEEDAALLEEMGDGLDYMDSNGLQQIDGIIQTFEENRMGLREAYEEQIEANREMIESERDRMRQEFEDQRSRIRGETGRVQEDARDQLDRIIGGN